MKHVTKVASSGRIATTQADPPLTNGVVENYFVLQAERMRVAREFLVQENRFIRHWEHPDWHNAKMPGIVTNLVINELKIVCVAISGWRQTRATWLLNKGNQPMGVTNDQLIELRAHADAFNEYVNTYNMIIDQGLDATIRFIQAYPLKTNVMELMEVASETV